MSPKDLPRPADAQTSPTWIDLPPNPSPPPHLRPIILPVFLPHAGCPHRCIFCNQNAITGQGDHDPAPNLSETVGRFMKSPPREAARIELAFYGGNFLGQRAEQVHRLMVEARELFQRGWIGSVRFSTRPDTIDDRRLALIAGGPVATVELGGQSMDDGVLAASRRGHTARDTAVAVDRLRRAGYRVGIQMMIGLPGQDERSALRSGVQIAQLKPDFVRIYPCLVLAGSPLETAYRQDAFRPLSLAQAVTTAGRLWRVFAHQKIPVIRMGLQDSTELAPGRSLIAGPYHPAFGHLVFSALCLQALIRLLKRHPAAGRAVAVKTHPSRISQVRGQGNANLATLIQQFSLADLRVRADPGMPARRLAVVIQ